VRPIELGKGPTHGEGCASGKHHADQCSSLREPAANVAETGNIDAAKLCI
jgi:hypothetical protein